MKTSGTLSPGVDMTFGANAVNDLLGRIRGVRRKLSQELGFLVQTWSQAHLSATRAAVIMTLEPVFAAVIAVAVAGEQLGLREVVGGALVLAAMAIVELGARHGRDAALPRVECC